MARRAFRAALVVLLVLGLGTLEVAARANDTAAPGVHEMTVRYDRAYQRTYEWNATFVRVPSPFSAPYPLLHVDIQSSSADGVALEEGKGLQVQVWVFLNGQQVSSEGIGFEGGGNGGAKGRMFETQPLAGWRYGTNEVRVVATVSHVGQARADGQFDVTLGPLEVVHSL